MPGPESIRIRLGGLEEGGREHGAQELVEFELLAPITRRREEKHGEPAWDFDEIAGMLDHPDDQGEQLDELRAEFNALRAVGWTAKGSVAFDKELFAEPPAAGLLVREARGGLQVLTDRVVFQLRPDADLESALESLRLRLVVLRRLRFAPRLFLGRLRLGRNGEAALDAEAIRASLETIGELPGVLWIEPDLVEAPSYRDDPDPPALDRVTAQLQRPQWSAINLFGAWERGVTGAGVELAIIDYGFAAQHPELSPVSPWSGSFDHEEDFATRAPGEIPVHDHGTACAGMAAARRNAIGIQGVSYGCSTRLIALGTDKTTHASLLARALACAVRPASELGDDVEAPAARLISCSQGPSQRSFRRISTPVRMALDLARDRNVPVFWAVAHARGEAAADQIIAHPAVSGVGAVTTGKHYTGGATGAGLEFVAPGWRVVTTVGTASWGEVAGGSSLAAPCVAGLAALMLDRNPGLTAPRLRQLLRLSCERLGTDAERARGRSRQYGFGIPDAVKAIEAAAQG